MRRPAAKGDSGDILSAKEKDNPESYGQIHHFFLQLDGLPKRGSRERPDSPRSIRFAD